MSKSSPEKPNPGEQEQNKEFLKSLLAKVKREVSSAEVGDIIKIEKEYIHKWLEKSREIDKLAKELRECEGQIDFELENNVGTETSQFKDVASIALLGTSLEKLRLELDDLLVEITNKIKDLKERAQSDASGATVSGVSDEESPTDTSPVVLESGVPSVLPAARRREPVNTLKKAVAPVRTQQQRRAKPVTPSASGLSDELSDIAPAAVLGRKSSVDSGSTKNDRPEKSQSPRSSPGAVVTTTERAVEARNEGLEIYNEYREVFDKFLKYRLELDRVFSSLCSGKIDKEQYNKARIKAIELVGDPNTNSISSGKYDELLENRGEILDKWEEAHKEKTNGEIKEYFKKLDVGLDGILNDIDELIQKIEAELKKKPNKPEARMVGGSAPDSPPFGEPVAVIRQPVPRNSARVAPAPLVREVSDSSILRSDSFPSAESAVAPVVEPEASAPAAYAEESIVEMPDEVYSDFIDHIINDKTRSFRGIKPDFTPRFCELFKEKREFLESILAKGVHFYSLPLTKQKKIAAEKGIVNLRKYVVGQLDAGVRERGVAFVNSKHWTEMGVVNWVNEWKKEQARKEKQEVEEAAKRLSENLSQSRRNWKTRREELIASARTGDNRAQAELNAMEEKMRVALLRDFGEIDFAIVGGRREELDKQLAELGLVEEFDRWQREAAEAKVEKERSENELAVAQRWFTAKYNNASSIPDEPSSEGIRLLRRDLEARQDSTEPVPNADAHPNLGRIDFLKAIIKKEFFDVTRYPDDSPEWANMGVEDWVLEWTKAENEEVNSFERSFKSLDASGGTVENANIPVPERQVIIGKFAQRLEVGKADKAKKVDSSKLLNLLERWVIQTVVGQKASLTYEAKWWEKAGGTVFGWIKKFEEKEKVTAEAGYRKVEEKSKKIDHEIKDAKGKLAAIEAALELCDGVQDANWESLTAKIGRDIFREWTQFRGSADGTVPRGGGFPASNRIERLVSYLQYRRDQLEHEVEELEHKKNEVKEEKKKFEKFVPVQASGSHPAETGAAHEAHDAHAAHGANGHHDAHGHHDPEADKKKKKLEIQEQAKKVNELLATIRREAHITDKEISVMDGVMERLAYGTKLNKLSVDKKLFESGEFERLARLGAYYASLPEDQQKRIEALVVADAATLHEWREKNVSGLDKTNKDRAKERAKQCAGAIFNEILEYEAAVAGRVPLARPSDTLDVVRSLDELAKKQDIINEAIDLKNPEKLTRPKLRFILGHYHVELSPVDERGAVAKFFGGVRGREAMLRRMLTLERQREWFEAHQENPGRVIVPEKPYSEDVEAQNRQAEANARLAEDVNRTMDRRQMMKLSAKVVGGLASAGVAGKLLNKAGKSERRTAPPAKRVEGEPATEYKEGNPDFKPNYTAKQLDGYLASPNEAELSALYGDSYTEGTARDFLPKKLQRIFDKVAVPVASGRLSIVETTKVNGVEYFEQFKREKPEIIAAAKEASEKYGVPLGVVLGILVQESRGYRQARSGPGAKGLMQIMDSTAVGEDLGWSSKEEWLENCDQIQPNIDTGTKYIKKLMGMFGDRMDLVFAAYNAGPTGTLNKIEDYASAILGIKNPFDKDKDGNNIPNAKARKFIEEHNINMFLVYEYYRIHKGMTENLNQQNGPVIPENMAYIFSVDALTVAVPAKWMGGGEVVKKVKTAKTSSTSSTSTSSEDLRGARTSTTPEFFVDITADGATAQLVLQDLNKLPGLKKSEKNKKIVEGIIESSKGVLVEQAGRTNSRRTKEDYLALIAAARKLKEKMEWAGKKFDVKSIQRSDISSIDDIIESFEDDMRDFIKN